MLAMETGLPIIMINNPIVKGIDFKAALGKIKQDHVLLIDEFEKLFPKNDSDSNKYHTQDSWLTFLDGVSGLCHKRLVILTTNDELADKLMNRPSRVLFYKKYNYMSKEVYNAILDDKLINKAYRQDLEENLDPSSCTIDILTSIINQVNILDIPYSDFKGMFNYRERIITYSKFRKEPDGSWKWIEDVQAKREITMDSTHDTIYHLIGYGSKILKNEADALYYEAYEFVPTGTKDEDGDDNLEKKPFYYKLSKNKYEKIQVTL
jgi:hypothetical protein